MILTGFFSFISLNCTPISILVIIKIISSVVSLQEVLKAFAGGSAIP